MKRSTDVGNMVWQRRKELVAAPPYSIFIKLRSGAAIKIAAEWTR